MNRATSQEPCPAAAISSQWIAKGAMAEPADPSGRQSFQFEESFIGRNPFPKDDPRHAALVQVARFLAEATVELQARIALKTENEEADDVRTLMLDTVAGHFDIHARAITAIFGDYHNLDRCEEALDRLIEGLISWAKTTLKMPSWIDRDEFFGSLRFRLIQRRAIWKHWAHTTARDAERQRHSPVEVSEAKAAGADTRVPHPRRAQWLSEQLRKKKWNVHELQQQQGPNWKTSRRVLNGLPVKQTVLEKLATALNVQVRDIPSD